MLTGNIVIAILFMRNWASPGLARYSLGFAATGNPHSINWRANRTYGVFYSSIALLAIITLYLISFMMITWGRSLSETLGNFGFLGGFLRRLGDILNMVIKVVVGLAGAGIFSSFAGRWGETLSRQRNAFSQITHTVLAIAAGAMLAVLLAATVNWFYQFNEPKYLLYPCRYRWRSVWPGCKPAFQTHRPGSYRHGHLLRFAHHLQRPALH